MTTSLIVVMINQTGQPPLHTREEGRITEASSSPQMIAQNLKGAIILKCSNLDQRHSPADTLDVVKMLKLKKVNVGPRMHKMSMIHLKCTDYNW